MNVGGNFPSAINAAKVNYAQVPGPVSLDVPPSLLGLTPGLTDTEYESDPGWLYQRFGPTAGPGAFSGAPNWDARIAGTAPAISFSQRKSFVTLQPGDNNVSAMEAAYYYPNPITWVANTPKWYWAGGGPCYEYVADSRRGIAIFANAAGLPDNTNKAVLGNIDAGSGQQLAGYFYVANALTVVNGTTANLARAVGSHWKYFALYMKGAATRASITIEAWVFNDDGQRMQVASMSFAALTATYWVGWYLRAATAPASGFQMNILQSDFWRECNGVTPPWVR